jgi:hypothetical protein
MGDSCGILPISGVIAGLGALLLAGIVAYRVRVGKA